MRRRTVKSSKKDDASKIEAAKLLEDGDSEDEDDAIAKPEDFQLLEVCLSRFRLVLVV